MGKANMTDEERMVETWHECRDDIAELLFQLWAEWAREAINEARKDDKDAESWDFGSFSDLEESEKHNYRCWAKKVLLAVGDAVQRRSSEKIEAALEKLRQEEPMLARAEKT